MAQFALRPCGPCKIRPNEKTAFEQEAADRKLRTPEQIFASHDMFRWAKLHRQSRYVPEEFLRAWGLTVHVGEL